jgi:hypothetical protein
MEARFAERRRGIEAFNRIQIDFWIGLIFSDKFGDFFLCDDCDGW